MAFLGRQDSPRNEAKTVPTPGPLHCFPGVNDFRTQVLFSCFILILPTPGAYQVSVVCNRCSVAETVRIRTALNFPAGTCTVSRSQTVDFSLIAAYVAKYADSQD